METYARRHAKEDAGALAWLVIGYARTLDHEYAKAIDPLNHAKAGASELGDYVAYYLGDAYLKTGHNAEALAAIADFGKNFPDSLLIRDAHLAVRHRIAGRRARGQEAATLLEKDRAPVRSDLELSIGRAYEAAGEKQRAIDAFRNVYFNLPNSFEADAAGAELRKLGVSGSSAEQRTRADLLFKSQTLQRGGERLPGLVERNRSGESHRSAIGAGDRARKSGRSHDARQLLNSIGAQQGDGEAERLYLLARRRAPPATKMP